MVNIAPKNVSLHSDEMLKYTEPKSGWEPSVKAAKAMALTAYRLMNNQKLVDYIKKSFMELKK